MEVLDKLDAQITSAESEAAEAKAKAEEKRGEITNGGESLPEIGSDDFKAMTEELQGHYATFDEKSQLATELKEQRGIVARSLGVPAPDPGGESKGITPDELAAAIAAAQPKGGYGGREIKMGTSLLESPEFKALQESGKLGTSARIGTELLGKALSRTEFKDLISQTGVAPFKDPLRTQFEPLKQRPVRLLELLQTIPTNQESVKYAQMTVATHNVEIVADPTTAADIGSGADPEAEPPEPGVTAAQAGLKPDAAYTFVPKTAEVETIAHGLPIHRNTLADVPQLEAILNEEMVKGLYLFLESEVLTGDGTSGHLLGIQNQTGIVSQAIGSDTLLVAIHKALTGSRLLFEEPTLGAIHPEDWETIRLMRAGGSTTTDGPFLFGPPSQAVDPTIWGIPFIPTPVVPKGQPIIGDWSAAQLYLREGVTMLASDSHKDFFMRNLIQLLAEMRAGLGVRRPGAFAKVTSS